MRRIPAVMTALVAVLVGCGRDGDDVVTGRQATAVTSATTTTRPAATTTMAPTATEPPTHASVVPAPPPSSVKPTAPPAPAVAPSSTAEPQIEETPTIEPKGHPAAHTANTTCPAAVTITNTGDTAFAYMARYGLQIPLVTAVVGAAGHGENPTLDPGASITIDVTPAVGAWVDVFIDGKLAFQINDIAC